MTFRPQFTVRAMLAVFLVVAVVIPIAQRWYRWHKWSARRDTCARWASTLQREPNHCESLSFQLDGKTFLISTAELEASRDGRPVYDRALVDATRFYVLPPGRWVDSIDDALRAWERVE